VSHPCEKDYKNEKHLLVHVLRPKHLDCLPIWLLLNCSIYSLLLLFPLLSFAPLAHATATTAIHCYNGTGSTPIPPTEHTSCGSAHKAQSPWKTFLCFKGKRRILEGDCVDMPIFNFRVYA